MWHIWGTPDIDLLANRLNHKVAEYASWKPDPEYCFINAFSKKWKQFDYIYCFPPFTSIWKTLSKIRKVLSRGLLIAPLWSTQSWFRNKTIQHTRNGRNFAVRKALIAFNQRQMMLSPSFHCYTIRGKVIGPFVMSEVLWII